MHSLSQFELFSHLYFCSKWLLYCLPLGDSLKGLLLNYKMELLVKDIFLSHQRLMSCLWWLITWSIDEDSKEEQAHLCYTNNIGYSTFCSYPPEMVKEMPKKVLVKEVQRLQLALGEQSKMAKLSQQQCERLKNERILCRICFERDIGIVLLPCRHHVLCEPCSDKCQSCPICRVPIESKLSVNDAVNSDEPSSDIV